MAQEITSHPGLTSVRSRIQKAMKEAGRDDVVTLVAISKLQSVEEIEQVAAAGQIDFGENYVQEALTKQAAFTQKHNNICWHFTGHIQSRKAKDVVGRFKLIHTLDSEKLALLLEQAAAQKNICQPVLIQVNVGAESQKSGVAINDLFKLAEKVASCQHLDLQGLMCLPPVFDAGMAARPHFELLHSLKEKLSAELGFSLAHLSMGMSGDLEAAIWSGSTLVRVGTDIFGQRVAN